MMAHTHTEREPAYALGNAAKKRRRGYRERESSSRARGLWCMEQRRMLR